MCYYYPVLFKYAINEVLRRRIEKKFWELKKHWYTYKNILLTCSIVVVRISCTNMPAWSPTNNARSVIFPKIIYIRKSSIIWKSKNSSKRFSLWDINDEKTIIDFTHTLSQLGDYKVFLLHQFLPDNLHKFHCTLLSCHNLDQTMWIRNNMTNRSLACFRLVYLQ